MPTKTKMRRVKLRQLTGTLPRIAKGKPQEMANGFPVTHYSASAMSLFSSNPLMFKVNYVNRDRFESTQNISGVLGKAFHKALEVYYRGNPDFLPKDEAEAVEMGLKFGMHFLNEYNDGFIEYSEKIANKQDVLDRFSFLYTAYVTEHAYNPAIQILSTEECLEETIDVEWKGHRLVLPVPLKGYLDKLIRDVDGKLKIIDYKSCYTFSDQDELDGAKMLQAVIYYLLVYACYGEAPHSIIFEEAKWTKNGKSKTTGLIDPHQVHDFEMVYADLEFYFDFFFRFYEDMTNGLNGKMVYVPNIKTMFDNELSLVAYTHRLDIPAEQAQLMKELQVDNITDLFKAKIANAGSMRKFLLAVEGKIARAQNINYARMQNHEKIETKLLEHGMILHYDSTVEGATVDLFRYEPSMGLKMSRIAQYVADVEQVLGIDGIRVLAPIRGSTLVGFEVPRATRSFPASPGNLGFELAIGQTIDGTSRYFDIREAPHMLVAGSAGSGKSYFLHTIIKQLLKTGAAIHIFDPKQVDFREYKGTVDTYADTPEDIELGLLTLVDLMEARYTDLAAQGHRNVKEAGTAPIFVIIDEYADLTHQNSSMPKTVQRLAQKGRAAGIHIVLATQRASTKVISGDVKVNFPVKAVFRMAKATDSLVMLDEKGAEKLKGKGDMLFQTADGLERLQAFSE